MSEPTADQIAEQFALFHTERATILSQPTSAGIKERGAVFTRRETVDFILDLAGYTSDKPLHQLKLLEPSFGCGAFLIPTVERLLVSYFSDAPDTANVVEDLSRAITMSAGRMRSVYLHPGR